MGWIVMGPFTISAEPAQQARPAAHDEQAMSVMPHMSHKIRALEQNAPPWFQFCG
jgi:hypothetical protein